MTQMITADAKNIIVDNGITSPALKSGNGGAGIPAQDKQPSAKKTALRDVQNQNGVLSPPQQENFSFLGGCLNMDTVKVCGNKRLKPERPPSSPLYPALSNTCVNEHIMNARRRFELELGRGRIQNNLNKTSDPLQSRQLYQFQQDTPQKQTHLRTSTNYSVPVATANNMLPPTTNSFGGPSPSPTFPVNYGLGMQAPPTDSLKVTLESPNSVASKPKDSDEEQRTMRFSRLQKFLKECDESTYGNYIHMLRHLSPTDLSRHAFGLETRVIQLTLEEGKEMERTTALNVLGKAVPASNPMQTIELLEARK